ncbi:1-acyl-sn-glycerol-3-phosphate acyltransferase PLS1 [Pelomyxa schiedti]|nr:1-acyl-sn-glycerol-3-phosphate acyltransferase PLS1 [Pelomyxa schiedti]
MGWCRSVLMAIGVPIGVVVFSGYCAMLLLMSIFALAVAPFKFVCSGGHSAHYGLVMLLTTWAMRSFSWIFESLNSFEFVWYGADVPPHETAVVVSNHTFAFDWLTAMLFARRKGMLSLIKFFLKDSIKYVPGFGLAVWMTEFIFVSRDWAKDSVQINASLSRLKSYGIPFWVVSYIEGTRFSIEKAEQSRAYAKSKGLPELHHVLLPRTKGIITAIQSLRDGYCDALYDITIAYEGPSKPTPISVFCTGKIHVHVSRWPLSDLPQEPTKLHEFLVQVWEGKDKLLEHWHQHKVFPGPVLCLPNSYVPIKLKFL